MACESWQHRWVKKKNRYDQVYFECSRCGSVKGS